MKCNLIIFDWFKLSNSKEFPVLFLRGKVFGLQDKQVQVLPAMQMFSPPSALKRQVGLGGSGGSRVWVTRVSWTPSLSSIPGVLGLPGTPAGKLESFQQTEQHITALSWSISCVHVLLLLLLSVTSVEDHCSRMSALWWMWIPTMGSRGTQTACFKLHLKQMSFYGGHGRVPCYLSLYHSIQLQKP